MTATPAEASHPLDFVSHPTPQLRSVIAAQESVLGAADFQELLGAIRSTFGKYTARLAEFSAGADRARARHTMMDREVHAAAHVQVSCGKGCAGCCHYEVEVTPDEAVLLREVVQRGVPVDRDRLELQARRERQSVEWLRFWSPENRCVFLGADGACQIYEHRPSICRKHVVTSPVAACTTAGAAVAPVQILLAEILLSAALSLNGSAGGSLPKMLLAELTET
jgi:Fe-S-cluster containining protein